MTTETDSQNFITQSESPRLQDRIVLRDADDSIELKQLIPDDAQLYFDLIDFDRSHLSQNEDITARNYPTVESVLTSIEQPKKQKLRFGVWDQGEMVGSVNLTLLDDARGESGSWIGAAHIGHNYAARARKLLMDFGFNQLHLEEIISKIVVGNEASKKSVEKSGFSYKGIITEDGVDEWLYVLKNPNRQKV